MRVIIRIPWRHSTAKYEFIDAEQTKANPGY
jgi:hypothetical protein